MSNESGSSGPVSLKLDLDFEAINTYKAGLDQALANCVASYKFEKCVGYRDRKQV